MRSLYFSSFFLGQNLNEPSPTIDDAVVCVEKWLSCGQRPDIPAGSQLSISQGIEKIFDNETRVQSKRLSTTLGDAEFDVLGVRFKHLDSRNRSLCWYTDTIFSSSNNKTRISVNLSVASVNDDIVPLHFEPSRPKIVPDVIREFGAWDVHTVTEKHIDIGINVIEKFCDFLNGRRGLPVVILTITNKDGQFLVDPEKLSNKLAGIAYVCAIESIIVADELNALMRRRAPTYDGAIRIFWPGFNSKNPGNTQLWDSNRLKSERLDQRCQSIFETIAKVAVLRTLSVPSRWEDVERIAIRSQLKSDAESGGWADTVRLAEQMVDQSEFAKLIAQQELEETTKTLGEKLKDLERAESKSSFYEIKYLSLCFEKKKLPEFFGGHTARVSDALKNISGAFEERLAVFWGRVDYGACDQFEDVPSALKAIYWLATIYWEAKGGVKPEADLNASCLKSCGFQYSANQSESSIGLAPEQYEFEFEGRRYTLTNHIKKGNSPNPRHSLRIAFDFDPERKLVVIGFVGQHQKSARTN